MTTTAHYLAWLDAQIDATANNLHEQAGPGFTDAAAHLVDLTTARTVLCEFIASQPTNTPQNLPD